MKCRQFWRLRMCCSDLGMFPHLFIKLQVKSHFDSVCSSVDHRYHTKTTLCLNNTRTDWRANRDRTVRSHLDTHPRGKHASGYHRSIGCALHAAPTVTFLSHVHNVTWSQIALWTREMSAASQIKYLSVLIEHIELPAKLLDYFSRSNKSNMNAVAQNKQNKTTILQVGDSMYYTLFACNRKIGS